MAFDPDIADRGTRYVLAPHPTTPGPAVTIEVQVEWGEDRPWLRYAVEGDVDRIQWPSPGMPERADDLWKHTCFEAFVQTDHGYWEFNLSPSGQWASYRFDGYRQGMADALEAAVVDGLDGGEDYVALEAHIEGPSSASRLGLSAVIEDIHGNLSYWALAHPSDKPDFHHPDSFVLTLPLVEPA